MVCCSGCVDGRAGMKRAIARWMTGARCVLVSISLGVGLGYGVPAAWAERVTITLLHLNDVYEITPVAGGKSGGLSRVATVRQRLQQANPNTLTILAGDALSPSALGTAKVNGESLAGQQMVAVLNALGVDYATLGNHEFDLSAPQFLQRLRESRFQWISSNVLDASGQPFPGVVVNKIHTVKGQSGTPVRVGFLGLTLNSNRAAYVQYRDPVQSARSQVQALKRQGADIIVALTHLSLAEDHQVAAQVPEIDLILGGHEHENIQQWRLVTRSRSTCPDPGIPIFKADANVRTVYVHQLRYDTQTRCLAIASQLESITDAIPPEPRTEAVVQQWLQLGFAAFQQNGFEPAKPVATISQAWDGLEASVRNRSTVLTERIAQAMLQAIAGAELAIYNSGAIRIDDVIPPGVVTQYDVLRILPFEGTVVEVKMPGTLLQRVLTQGQANRGAGGFLQTANVTQNAAGQWLVQGQPLVGDREYRVAISSFLLSGREQGLEFLKTEGTTLKPISDAGDVRQVFIRYLSSNPQ